MLTSPGEIFAMTFIILALALVIGGSIGLIIAHFLGYNVVEQLSEEYKPKAMFIAEYDYQAYSIEPTKAYIPEEVS